MFALWVALQPWRWLWLPRLSLVRSWLCVGAALLAVSYQPFWIRYAVCLLYVAWAYVRTVNRARALMGGAAQSLASR